MREKEDSLGFNLGLLHKPDIVQIEKVHKASQEGNSLDALDVFAKNVDYANKCGIFFSIFALPLSKVINFNEVVCLDLKQ